MDDIFEAIASLRARGERGALATVICTRGSTPGKDTMRILIAESGSVMGTVGGGCVEAEVVDAALEVMDDEVPAMPEPAPQVSREQLALRERLLLPISDLDLSVRASNCLESENVRTISDLVRLSENELLNLKNFGKTSLREIKLKLINSGLELGMDVDAVGT